MLTVDKGPAVCDGCVCRPAIVRTVIGEGGLQKPGLSKPKRSSETSRKSRCPPALWGSGAHVCLKGDLGAPRRIT